MAKPFQVNVVDHSKVSPPENSTSPSILPLTFFDIPWLFFSPCQTLFFFEYSHSTSHFFSTTLPALKHSLSLTLQHYFPFAGNLVLQPDNSFKPVIVYNEGDTVSLSVAESSSSDSFFRLSGNHQRCCSEFYALLPELPNKASEDKQGIPLLAAKVTIFSNSGICIGLAYHHVAADGRTFNNFMKTWAVFCRDSSNFFIKSPPFLNRTVIKDARGLESIFLNDWRKKKLSCEGVVVLGNETKVESSDMVRATFVMSPADMDKVKHSIVARCKKKNEPQPPLMSPYNLTSAYVWVCLTKAQEKVSTEKCYPEDPDYFAFNAGGITRLDYPVPTSYLGNCIGFARCMATRAELQGEDGIIVAANAIGNKVKALDRAVLDGAEKWISDWEALSTFSWSASNVIVVGSPKIDSYEMDFGWGRPKKIEEISIDNVNGHIAISFTESKDVRGGIEVGVALPKPKMDAFASAFTQGLP